MQRPMTPTEKIRFHGYFPALNVSAAVVTDNATQVYNCISWTVGVTNAWLWPGPTLANFDTFYARYGLRRAANGSVAAWGISATNMTHGSVSGPTHGPRWESKCGSDLRIQHGLNELVGASYGRVIAFYNKMPRHLMPHVGEIINVKPLRVTISAAQKKALAAQTSQISLTTREEFEKRFKAWKAAWFAPPLAISSDPMSRAHSPEFHALVALGASILPLVVEKLIDPNNFMALVLYDVLQPNPNLLVQHSADDDEIELGEQGRAVAVVAAYLKGF